MLDKTRQLLDERAVARGPPLIFEAWFVPLVV